MAYAGGIEPQALTAPARPAAPQGSRQRVQCCEATKKMEAGGIEPEDVEKAGLTTSGQTGASGGQAESKNGQVTAVTPAPKPSPPPSIGHPGTSAGQISAPTEPPLLPARADEFPDDPSRLLALWHRLPAPIKKAIWALVDAIEPQRPGLPRRSVEGGSCSLQERR